jgi:O-antigen ligase
MWKRVEWLLVLFILIFCAGLLTPSEAAEGGTDVLMNQVSIIAQTIVIPLTALLVLANWGRMVAGFRAAKLPLAMSFLLLVSTLWSIDKHVTARRGVIFFFGTLFAIYLGCCLSKARHLYIYALVSLIAVIGCFAIAIFLPSYGVSTDVHLGEWKGLFQHKNALGRQMVFAIAVVAGASTFRRFSLRWATILGALALLALSRSGTALFGFAALLFGYFALGTMRVRVRQTLPLWAALLPMVLISAVLILIFRAEISILIGKDPTLTGRTEIWATAFRGIAQKPMFGWGYAVFWRQIYLRDLFNGSAPTHAHDGFIDIVVDTGYFGLGIFALTLYSYITMCTKKVLNLRIPLTGFYSFSFLYVVIFIALNLTESNLLRYHTFLWIPFVSVYTAMSLDLIEEKSAHSSLNVADSRDLVAA